MGIPIIAVVSACALVVGYLARRRIRDAIRGRTPIITDDVLRTILTEGAIEALDRDDEPLDDDAIRAAEDEFWEEDWGGDPEAWRE